MSELDEYKRQKRETMEAHKVKNEEPGGVLATPQPAEHILPKTFRQKWDNFWYHYKWQTFGTAAAVFLLAAFVVEMINRPDPDTSLSIATQIPMESYRGGIEAEFSKYLSDFDGDGAPELETQTYQLDIDGMDPQTVMANTTRLMGNMSLNTYFLYMTDEMGYEYLKKNDIQFLDLTGIADTARIVGKDRFSLNGTAFFQKLEIDERLGNFYLCFIDPDSYSAKRMEKKEVAESYERQWAFFQDLLGQIV